MKKYLFLLLVCFTTNFSIAQLKVKDFDSLETLYNTPKIIVDSMFYNLPSIKNSSNKQHIRITYKGQLIDIYQTHENKYSGTLTNYITEYKTIKKKKTKTESYVQYYETQILDSTEVKRAFENITLSKQNRYGRLSEKIDMNEPLLLEFFIDNKYSFQTYYFFPPKKEDIQKAILYQEIYYIASSAFSLRKKYYNFEKTLPKRKTFLKKLNDNGLHYKKKKNDILKLYKPF